MIIEKRNFYKGINSDIDARLLDDGTSLNLMNCRLGVTSQGRLGRLENTPGSTLISQSVYSPYGTHQCIGSCPDIARSRILYALWNSFDNHGIFCFDYSAPSTPVIYAVLYDSQVTGGLNFSRDYRIDRDMRVVGDLLFWTDNNEQPRRVNIEAGIKLNHPAYSTTVAAYTSPLQQSVITIIRNPPAFPLTWVKSQGGIPENYIAKEAFQFYSGYEYRDGEISVLSPLSVTANFNPDDGTADSTANRITITLPFDETIQQDVQEFFIAAKFLNSGKSFIIKRWNKEVSSQLSEINAHNAGTTALNYIFYNNDAVFNVPVNPAKANDLVPLQSKSLEYSNQRIFLANNLLGYDTPITSSLTAQVSSISTSGGGTLDVYLGQAQFLINGTYFSYRAYYVNISSITPNGWYRLSGSNYTQTAVQVGSYPPYPTMPAVPTNINLTQVVFVGTTNQDVSDSIGGSNITSFTLTDTLSNTTLTLSNGVTRVQKSDSTKRVGIVFYDKALRRCGVYTSDDLVINIPDRNYNYSILYTGISWALSNSNAINEIPDWAYYYQIVITKCLNVLSFQEAVARQPGTFGAGIKYVTKDANGAYVYNNVVLGDEVGIAINTNSLVGYGMGYTFSEGDIVKIYQSTTSTIETVQVTGQEGEYIICSFVDLGSTTGRVYVYEIRTPAKYQEEPPFYEVSQFFEIVDPTEITRQYLVLNGAINGDVYLATRTHSSVNYTTERMSPNDDLWKIWNTDSGRPNYIDRIGQQRKKTSVKWSNTIIPGTKVNGLCTYDPLDEKILQTELNEINKIQLASKIPEQGQGNIMLAVCTQQSASMYLGEVQLNQAALNSDISTTTSVIGTVNILKGGFGTTQKSTIVEYLGLVFGLDIMNGTAWHYSNNGQDSISQYGNTRFFANYCKDYLAASSNNIRNINGFYHIPTCVDPFHKEALFTLPGLIYENYADVLPSYSSVPSYATSIIDRFDLHDQLGKTMLYKFKENNWGSNFEFMAEQYDYLNNTTIAFKDGYVYTMYTNTTNWNTFFGEEMPVRICTTGNLNPSLLKDLCNISLESNAIPDFSVAMSNYPNVQITDLSASDYTDEQGIFRADWLMDRLSPNTTGTADERLYTGDPLTDFSVFFMFEFQQFDELFFCNFVNIGYNESYGNRQIANTVNS